VTALTALACSATVILEVNPFLLCTLPNANILEHMP
jgi:hypothetical protein